MRVLDTNLFVRAIANDHSQHSPQSRAMFTRLASGDEEATTCEAVIAEVVFVLSSAMYRFSRTEVQLLFGGYLAVRGLRLENKGRYLRALQLFAQSKMHFVDCVLVAHAETDATPTVISYDRDFDRIPGIRREEP